MLSEIPSNNELQELIGSERFKAWDKICSAIDNLYEMDRLWNNGGKAWKYEYKYRRGGKTLCALYARENCFAFMIIFGKDERAKFEAEREKYSAAAQEIYDSATTYHDGKWMVIEMENDSFCGDIINMLAIKRKPNRK